MTRMRSRLCVAGVLLLAGIPAFGSIGAAAAGTTGDAPAAISARSMPFLPLTAGERAAAGHRSFRRGGRVSVTLLGSSDPSGAVVDGAGGPARPLTGASISPDDLASFPGTAQANTIKSFGVDQEVTPPNEDIAVGLTDLVEVVNSTVEVFNRAGVGLAAADLNTFMRVDRGYHSSDPRVIYDSGSGRFWITVTEVPNSACPAAAPVLIAVSPNSNALPLTRWLVYSLPIGSTPGTEFGDQPGLGVSLNTIAVAFDDFDCQSTFLGSEVDILQKSDLANDVGLHQDDFFIDGPFAPQPVQEPNQPFYTQQYVVANESDCGATACPTPQVEVDTFQGTPESGGVTVNINFVTVAPTAVDDATGFLPPADQPSPGPHLQTNDDRFLNAVATPNRQIWTAGGTSCEPPGDTVQRACLDYVEIDPGPNGITPTLTDQIDNVGVDGADLFYPEVSVDNTGNMFTVFDESSTTMDPSIMDATVAMSDSTLSPFQTLHTSPTYYDGRYLFSNACDSEGCRWGDYSGAASDPTNVDDVWVVSGSEDSSVAGPCTTHACWNTWINQLTLIGPQIETVTPAFSPLVGGQTITVGGFDFASDSTLSMTDTFTTVPIPVHIISPELLTFVTPPTPPTSPNGGPVFISVTDSLGSPLGGAYEYVPLANYVPLTPFRILDTRTPGSGGPIGAGVSRLLMTSGVGIPVSPLASAVVLNVTEVGGTAPSLLTIYPVGSARPNASNLNFAAHTTIANLVTVVTSGSEYIYNAVGSVNVVVDVEGYFMPEPSTDLQGLFHPIAPVRVCDTRSMSPTPACRAHGALGNASVMVVNVTGIGSDPVPGNGTAGAAVLNVTGVAGTKGTYLSVFPTTSTGGCAYNGSHAPPTSTLNLPAEATGANRVMVALGPATTGGPDTSVCVYNAAGTTSVILDANGWYGSATATATPAGYQYEALLPTRICDTRVGSANCAKGLIGAAASRLVGVDGVGLVPAAGGSTVIEGVIVNLTAIAPSAGTFLTLYPSDPGTLQTPPNASDLNVNAGETLPNLAVVQLDTTAGTHNGFVSLFNRVGSVNAVIDLEGWFQ